MSERLEGTGLLWEKGRPTDFSTRQKWIGTRKTY